MIPTPELVEQLRNLAGEKEEEGSPMLN